MILLEPTTIEYTLYTISIASFTFWIVIWVMHICALTNAKLKLHKRSCTLAASKRKRKIEDLSEKFLPSCVKSNNKCSYSLGQTRENRCCLHNKQQQQQEICPTSICIEKHHSYKDATVNSDNNDDCLQKDTFSYINLPLPGVSIIKPLVGVDTNLRVNLESFFQMDYPTYELLFCVQDPDDTAILIVRELFNLFPQVDAKLFIGGSCVGVNPKINNMHPAYEEAKYELVLISDSGIFMKRDTLLDMVGHMYEDTALVHQLPFVCETKQGFQSILEKVYFGTAHARAYLTADLLNINCPTGMSALMRKHLIDEVGGIKAFGPYLAEDFFFAKSFTDRNWKINISSQPAWQNSANSSDTLSTLNSRFQRWIKLRFAMVPHWTLLEPFSECILLGLLAAMSLNFLWALDPMAIFIFHIIIWFLFDYKLLCTIQNSPLTFSKTDFIIAWLIRECLALVIFIEALMNPLVTWRSRIFRLKWGGYAEELPTCSNISTSITRGGKAMGLQTVVVIRNGSIEDNSNIHMQPFPCNLQAHNNEPTSRNFINSASNDLDCEVTSIRPLDMPRSTINLSSLVLVSDDRRFSQAKAKQSSIVAH